jgi:hypothetical protein
VSLQDIQGGSAAGTGGTPAWMRLSARCRHPQRRAARCGNLRRALQGRRRPVQPARWRSRRSCRLTAPARSRPAGYLTVISVTQECRFCEVSAKCPIRRGPTHRHSSLLAYLMGSSEQAHRRSVAAVCRSPKGTTGTALQACSLSRKRKMPTSKSTLLATENGAVSLDWSKARRFCEVPWLTRPASAVLPRSTPVTVLSKIWTSRRQESARRTQMGKVPGRCRTRATRPTGHFISRGSVPVSRPRSAVSRRSASPGCCPRPTLRPVTDTRDRRRPENPRCLPEWVGRGGHPPRRLRRFPQAHSGF